MDATENSSDIKASPADLVVALEGFDGPIDLLLGLAREQKVDLGKISILALAEQYLAFISSARKLKLEVAADYLVMAAWLGYLKSRLLLPVPPEGEADPADMAEALKFQLLRLEAMQKAAQQLQDLPRLGLDVFMRGLPEKIAVEERPIYYLPLYDLLTALGAPQRRRKPETYNVTPSRLYTIEESARRLRLMLGIRQEWDVLFNFLPEMLPEEGLEARSALASTFAATLEMVKAGEIELRQDGSFSPLYLRRRPQPPTISDET